jgi:hypothetical protein
MSKPSYVMHDRARWRVREQYEDDGEQWYSLVKRRRPGQPGLMEIAARVADCDPDTHEPVRVWRNDKAVIRFYPRTGVVTVAEPRRRPSFSTTLAGIFAMCARQQGAILARDRAFRKRTRAGRK